MISVAIVALIACGAVLLEGPGAPAGPAPGLVFAANAVFAALGAIEAVRGAMRRTRTALGLAGVLALAAVFQWFGSSPRSHSAPTTRCSAQWVSSGIVGVVTISLVIVVVVTSVLRAEQVRLRGTEDSSLMAIAPDGVLLEPSFVRVLGGRLMRANRRAELFAVLVVRIDALSRISTAFGVDEADHVRQAAGAPWPGGCRPRRRRSAPTTTAR